jgi:hypothetical protein
MINSNMQRAYEEVLKLTATEKMTLISKILPELSRELKKDTRFNIYDLKGLGKEIWKGVDAQEYVNEERDAWE